MLPPDQLRAPPNAVLVRANRDIVLGTAAGLHVLRRGFWERLVFDAKAMRFSATLSPRDAAGWDVLSLAEAADGTLFVGTASGLIAVKQGYDGPATLWRTEADGLSSRRVEHLAPFADGVLVGGPAGARLFTAAGAAAAIPVGLSGQPITQLRALPAAILPEGTELDGVALGDSAPTGIAAVPDNDDDGKTRIMAGDGTMLRSLPRPPENVIGLLDRPARVLVNGPDGLEIWDARTDTGPSLLPGAIPAGIQDWVIDKGAHHLVAARPGAAMLWDLDAGTSRLLRLPGRSRSVGGLGFTADGRYAIAVLQNAVAWIALTQNTSWRWAPIQPGQAFDGLVQDGDTIQLRDGHGQALWLSLGDGQTRPVTGAARALVATASGVYRLDADGASTSLVTGAVDDAIWIAAEQRLFVLRNRELLAAEWDSKAAPGALRHVMGQAGIVFQNRIAGLAELALDGAEGRLAVFTDQGIAFWRDGHFEHFKNFPTATAVPDVTSVAANAGRLVAATSEGVFLFESGNVHRDSAGEVHDILTIPAAGVTAVARGDRLELWRRGQALDEAPTRFDDVSASVLALDREGRLLANDGDTIIRFDADFGQRRELFTATPTMPSEFRENSGITSLIVAHDGTVWASAGGSVFRWREGDEKPQEFSNFVDLAAAPFRSEMISRVVETVDGRIWVVASNESHITWNGMELTGGLFEFDGSAFRRSDLTSHSGWFITGYTDLGDGSAIVGTTEGFASHTPDRYALFADLSETSYTALRRATPAIYLGRRGARLGQDTWLFGTASGVVGWRAGSWFMPDRLNWMLPDFPLHNYGARTVHALDTDEDGRIYAGTDRGLLVYDSGGGDALSFLVQQEMGNRAFEDLERAKLAEVAAVMRRAAPDDARRRAVTAQLQRLKADIDELRNETQPGRLQPLSRRDPTAETRAGPADRMPASPAPDLPTVELKRRQDRLAGLDRDYRALLLRVMRENPALGQELLVEPLDFSAMRPEIGRTDWAANAVFLEYLPTSHKLYIQVLTRNATLIREVDVNGTELLERATRAAVSLRAQARSVRGLADTTPSSAPDTLLADTLDADLEWLYDKLLRPVEPDLERRSSVFVLPYRQLTYLPFGALLRVRDPKPDYAIQHYAIGTLSSFYLLQLMLNHLDGVGGDVLAMGDPVGNLAGARLEVQRVAEITHSPLPPLIGADASVANLAQRGPKAHWIHLATHAILDQQTPESSYILMAGNARLGIAEISGLDLENVAGVVLSACETGIGAHGLEVATLAQAFAHAKVPSIVATLWPVADAAGTPLMEAFYEALQTRGDTVFAALAAAQRQMIESTNPSLRQPGAWAGYVAIGKP